MKKMPLFQAFWSFTYLLLHLVRRLPTHPTLAQARKVLQRQVPGLYWTNVRADVYETKEPQSVMHCLFLKRKTFLSHGKHQTLNLISCVVLGKSLTLSEFRAFHLGSWDRDPCETAARIKGENR